jgi:phosphohistidine phosphatase SixA
MRWWFRFLSFVVFAVCATAPQANASRSDLIAALKSGGHALLLRHAQTVPGIGDPPNFKLNDCSTQRNLSEEGRAQSRRIADALKAKRVTFDKTLTSQWCRCRDTARLLASKVEDFAALNSFFENREGEPKQTAQVRARLKTLPVRESWLLVTHQVNISALTGISPAMGEGVVVRVRGGALKPIGTLAL